MASDSEKAACKRKVRYSSDSAAKAALNKINPGRRLKRPYRIYKCPVCGGWHLSSKPKQ